ncbi:MULTISPECIES: iron-containing alcohol dehydrogenase [unclassified Archaeoglobus]|jgi:alcohol dehydrogenase class IV|uniref:iron-containing alcohol dehydrogenase n=1 Tax=unclassified Archaeoglobus TaxID=2643606 RepID=UPI0025C6C978|nr:MULTISPECIES: iron-containing alcohol dehydrogenase [unclassified Archaeoglobus]
MWWFVIPRTVFGDDAVQHLENEKAERVLIVTDKQLRELGYVDEVKKYLKAEKIEIFDDVEPEPSIETALKCSKIARDVDAQLIIALGGGSVLDVGKMARILLELDIDPELVTPFTDLYELGFQKKAKLIAIPTTSGTGADATWAMVLTDTKEKRKVLPANREAIPDLTILDYRFVEKMPPKLVAGTGMDALTHAIEGAVSPWRNDFSDAMCEKAVEIILENLEKSYSGDADARAKMHHAATMAGMGFGNSQVGLVHALGHAFGAYFKVHHGICVGVFLPYALQYYINDKESKKLLDYLAVRVKLKDAETLVERILEIMKNIEVPTKVSEIVEEKEFFEGLEEVLNHAINDACIVTSPRCPGTDEVRKLYEYAFYGKKIDF